MTWVSTLFHQGGPAMYLIVFCLAPSLGVVVAHVALGRRWSLVASLAAIAVILGIGVFGMLHGRSRVDGADYRDATPDEVEERHAAGYAEANVPLKAAGVVCGVLALGVIVAQLRRRGVSAASATPRSS